MSLTIVALPIGRFWDQNAWKSGLSLIEMIVVLTLISLATLGAMVTLASWLKKHQRDAVFVAVSSCDQWGRSHSKSSNCELHWDLDSNTIAKQESNSPKSPSVEQLASDIEVLVTSDAEYRSGRVTIAYRLGSCSTWAIKIKLNSGAKRWMICHGLTGELEIHDSSAASDTSIPQWITRSTNAP
jgi:prepilin-type N-terminal cleavage/methylation domain-containing protein